ncbi:unnamed protein product [Spirodela intermedia]|uniref:Uncharacterized protein n=1 Tax=Spirodela intermedia TaxID=51605 RepID=A0A7I8JMS6_SPIIN|nr:unnamed protein product [Spirodela intermedia]CAA6671115.1 unnamed protein product [Spirodela intermedia]
MVTKGWRHEEKVLHLRFVKSTTNVKARRRGIISSLRSNNNKSQRSRGGTKRGRGFKHPLIDLKVEDSKSINLEVDFFPKIEVL